MRNLAADWRLLVLAGGAFIAAGSAVVFSFFRRPSNPHEAERRRRSRLNQIGRICEGQVVELVEQPSGEAGEGGGSRRATNHGARKLICYSYSISGVTFQTAQDITDLLDRIRFESLVAGQHTGVKYDPANPSNSILIAEDWSGLR